MLAEVDYPFLNIFWTMIIFFCWVAWIWLLIMILTDLFRRHDVGGLGKAGWCIVLIALPFLGVLIYLIAHGDKMAQRNAEQAANQQAQFNDYVKTVASSGGAASEIEKANSLRASGAITDAEFEAIKASALSS